MNKFLLYAGLLTITTGLAGCNAKPNSVIAKGVQNSVIDYQYTENSRAEVSFFNDPETKIDITGYVTNYSSGDIFITDKGLEGIFGLKIIETSEQDKSMMKDAEIKSDYTIISDEVIKLANDEHYFIFKDGSTMYVYDGEVKTLSNAIIKNDAGELSYPLFDIAFSFGYESIGTSIKDNVVTYTIFEDTDDNFNKTPDINTKENILEKESNQTEQDTDKIPIETISDANTIETLQLESLTETVDKEAKNSDEQIIESEEAASLNETKEDNDV